MRVDTSGTSCPQPVLMTKKAIQENQGINIIEVLTDNNTSKINVKKFLKSNGFNVEIEEEDEMFIIRGTL